MVNFKKSIQSWSCCFTSVAPRPIFAGARHQHVVSDAFFFNLRFQKTNTTTMPATKRPNSGHTETSPQPVKRSKCKDAMPSSDPLLAAEARIHELEQQVKDLHDWINDSGMTRSMSPTGFCNHG